MSNPVHEITFVANPLQRQFIESKAKADLFSSRMGEGKSTALAWAALYHTRHNPGATWYLIRDTWENNQATTMKTFFEWFPPGIMGTFHATKRMFTWAEGIAQGEVGFLGMDDPQDASKLMSRDMGGFGIDEPAPAVGSVGVDELIFDIAMSRLRQPNMKWYSAKLAENNPDETHWSYKRFVDPGTENFTLWQPNTPENSKNLPPSYYAELRKLWAHRPDLIRRFVEGDFGFQSIGKAVTPQWNDNYHLSLGLSPVPKVDLYVLWDFGHTPTAIITQRTPAGHWLILDSLVGDGIGTAELIADGVKPLLVDRYKGHTLHHIGDPTGTTADQSSIMRSPVILIKKLLGGDWRPGPVKIMERVEPLRAVLSRSTGGRSVVQVDRHRAPHVWHALRGGWHFHISRSGIVSGEPQKDGSSHPGDAMGYGAAVLFPLSKLVDKNGVPVPRTSSYFGSDGGMKIGPKVNHLPAHGSKLGS